MRSIRLIIVTFLLTSVSNAQVLPANVTEKLYKCNLHDEKLCEENEGNAELIEHILKVFSDKKGDKDIYTTEHVEELLEKTRPYNITKSDLKSFREDPSLCVAKLKPLLELVGETVGFSVSQEVLDEFCLEASLLYNISYYSVKFVHSIYANPGTSVLGFAVLTIFGTGVYPATRLRVSMILRSLGLGNLGVIAAFFFKPLKS